MIVVIVSVAIMGLLYQRIYLTPDKEDAVISEFQPLSASGTMPTTGIDRLHADVDAAKAVQVMLNQKNSETTKAMGE